MNRILGLSAFVLSLFGCDPAGSALVHRARDGARDLLHARASIEAGVARVECIAGVPGACERTRRIPACAVGAPACAGAPARRFALAAADGPRPTGVPVVRPCGAGAVDERTPVCDARVALR